MYQVNGDFKTSLHIIMAAKSAARAFISTPLPLCNFTADPADFGTCLIVCDIVSATHNNPCLSLLILLYSRFKSSGDTNYTSLRP